MSMRRRITFLPGFVIGAVALSLAGCVAAPPAPVRVTVEATAQATEAPPVKMASSTPAPPNAPAAVVTTPEPDAPVVPETFVMPDYRDWILQDAQDDLQSMGSYFMDQEDALYTRLQVNDSNWKVCSQDPAAGTATELSSTITLRTVKLSETCP